LDRGRGPAEYLQEAEVRGLFPFLASHFPGSIFAFDAFSPFCSGTNGPASLAAPLGCHGALGIDDLAQPESYAPG
jgi:O-methyltransferase involved in polyketide biosynthesis